MSEELTSQSTQPVKQDQPSDVKFLFPSEEDNRSYFARPAVFVLAESKPDPSKVRFSQPDNDQNGMQCTVQEYRTIGGKPLWKIVPLGDLAPGNWQVCVNGRSKDLKVEEFLFPRQFLQNDCKDQLWGERPQLFIDPKRQDLGEIRLNGKVFYRQNGTCILLPDRNPPGDATVDTIKANWSTLPQDGIRERVETALRFFLHDLEEGNETWWNVDRIWKPEKPEMWSERESLVDPVLRQPSEDLRTISTYTLFHNRNGDERRCYTTNEGRTVISGRAFNAPKNSDSWGYLKEKGWPFELTLSVLLSRWLEGGDELTQILPSFILHLHRPACFPFPGTHAEEATKYLTGNQGAKSVAQIELFNRLRGVFEAAMTKLQDLEEKLRRSRFPGCRERFDMFTEFIRYVENPFIRGPELYASLKVKPQIIFYGPPGTGKTYQAKRQADWLIRWEAARMFKGDVDTRTCFGIVQFHPNYAYEDFIKGLRPKPGEGEVAYEWEAGIFKKFVDQAGYLERLAFNLSRVTGDQTKQNKLVGEWNEKRSGIWDHYRVKLDNSTLVVGRWRTKQNEDPTAESWDAALKTIKAALGEDFLKNFFEEITGDNPCQDKKQPETDGSNQDETVKNPDNLSDVSRGADVSEPSHTPNSADDDEEDEPAEAPAEPFQPPFIFLIDEINRANLSSVLGELMFCLEYRGPEKGKVQLPGPAESDPSDSFFFLATNLYLIGTMNTVDRSTEPMDFAMRRRFQWRKFEPNYETLKQVLNKRGVDEQLVTMSEKTLKNLNRRLQEDLARYGDFQIGEAYFYRLPDIWELLPKNIQGTDKVKEAFHRLYIFHLRPLLEEYYKIDFARWRKAREEFDKFFPERTPANLPTLSASWKQAFETCPQAVLYGPPGTSKTYTLTQANDVPQDRRKLIQFHPSYDYGSFIQGLRPSMKENPETKKKHVRYSVVAGQFKAFCLEAGLAERALMAIVYREQVPTCKGPVQWERNGGAYTVLAKGMGPLTVTVQDDKVTVAGDETQVYEPDNSQRPYRDRALAYLVEKVKKHLAQWRFIIDEVNRADLASVFGELMYCLEYRGPQNSVVLPGGNATEGASRFPLIDGQERFFIPTNVQIAATMNTIDRSTEPMDFAMRRRFAWVECKPDKPTLKQILDERGIRNEGDVACAYALMEGTNTILKDSRLLGDPQIGHTYFGELGRIYLMLRRQCTLKNPKDRPRSLFFRQVARGPVDRDTTASLLLFTHQLEPLLEDYYRLSGKDWSSDRVEFKKLFQEPSGQNKGFY